MRNSFVQQLLLEMGRDERILLLTGDLGFKALEPFQEQFPDRFMNVGAAEANMIGVAAGFAFSGYTVLVYSIASFATMRCYEQVRVDVCYHKLNVKLVGIGGGYSYADQGVTHHTAEDIAIMRVLPNMKVVCPATAWEALRATEAIVREQGPAYIRLGLKMPFEVHKEDETFSLNTGFNVVHGTHITLVTTGNILLVGMETAKALERVGISVDLIHLPVIKPLDEKIVIASVRKTGYVITLEENSTIGGLGSAVADVILENGISVKGFKKFGLPDRYVEDVGSHAYMRKVCGLDAESIAREVRILLGVY